MRRGQSKAFSRPVSLQKMEKIGQNRLVVRVVLVEETQCAGVDIGGINGIHAGTTTIRVPPRPALGIPRKLSKS